MAYVSVPMGLTTQGEVLNSSYWTNAPGDGAMTWSQFANGNISPTNGTSDLTSLQFGDTTNGLVLDSNNNLHIYYNGVDSAYYSPSISQYGSEYILFFGIDEENQLGSFWIAQRRQLDRWGYTVAGGRLEAGGNTSKFYNSLDGYNWIKGIMPISYNWQSVALISGKNGILFLSTIQSVYLNNGDSVNNAPANYIQFADDSNVAILVGEQVDDPTLVTIQYIVPTGTYEYIKLVYKVDSAPTSITDGTAIDILQANRSVTVSGIANGNTYFFKIFTDVSESEPYEFTTTKPPIASNYVFELDLSTDGKDIVRYDATKDIGNHKQGELYGSGISIEDDILTASSWIYWDYDGTENPKFIPANCTLTFEYDAFFPNGEGYLDWYVIDSRGSQQIYWCFDTQHAFQSNKWYNCKTVAKVENGKIVRYKYVLDGNEVSSNTADINMPCVNTETSFGISQIYFRLTRTTKFKNMSIYFDFSEYHDGGGSGSGSSGRA